MAETEQAEKTVASLEEIATTTTKLLDKSTKRALHNLHLGSEMVEGEIRNALLLTQLLKELAALRALRG